MACVGRRGRTASRDVDPLHKPLSTCTPTCLQTLHRSMSVMASTPSTLAAPSAGRCSPKLLLSSLPSPQQLQQLHRSLSSVSCQYFRYSLTCLHYNQSPWLQWLYNNACLSVCPTRRTQRRRGLRKSWGRAASCNLRTDGCKFPTPGIISAQNFNFAAVFPQNGDFQPKFCIFRRMFFDNAKN